jgi:two-component system sensor histidine kinase BaeS
MIGVAAARTSRATSSPGTSGLKREDDLRRGMVADIAHELRTPVTILQGGTEELLDGIADPNPRPAHLPARRDAGPRPAGR